MNVSGDESKDNTYEVDVQYFALGWLIVAEKRANNGTPIATLNDVLIISTT